LLLLKQQPKQPKQQHGHPEAMPSTGKSRQFYSETLAPIFGGDLALKKENYNFNYFAAQLRIRIEMAFGIITRKWGILQHPLTNSLGSIKHMICCIARLHNFCIDKRLRETTGGGATATANAAGGEIETTLSPMQLAYMHAAAEAEQREILSDEYPQWSFSRDELLRAVKQRQLERPAVSTHRKRQRLTRQTILFLEGICGFLLEAILLLQNVGRLLCQSIRFFNFFGNAFCNTRNVRNGSIRPFSSRLEILFYFLMAHRRKKTWCRRNFPSGRHPW
jgi:hypothetical protein